MVRLPDIPQQTWLNDQVTRFKESTSGYLDSLFFDDQARQQEADIPPDFDAPGGRDQWEQAAIQRREEELRRQQEEEQRRIEAQQAATAQQQAEEAQRQQVADEQRRVEQTQQASGLLSNLGIPSPEEAFSQLQGVFNRPADHVSSTGVLDAAASSANPQPDQPPSSPVGDFLSWASGVTEPLFGSSNATPPTASDAGPVPDAGPAPDHSSTSGIFDTLGELPGRAAADLGRLAERFAPKTGFTEGLQQAYERIPGGADLGNLQFGDYTPRIAPATDESSRSLVESVRGAGEQVRSTASSALESVGVDPAVAYQAAQDVSGVLGPGGALIGGIQDFQEANQAVQAIKALRAAKIGEDVVLAAERELAQKAGSTLAGIQELTRGKRAAAATRRAESARDQQINQHPEFSAHDEAVQAAAQDEDVAFSALQQAEAQFGDRSPQFRQAERAWIDTQATHAEAIQAQEATRQRLLTEIPDVPTPPASTVTPGRAQKAFNSMEEIYATAVTAERDAIRRFGPGSEEHQAAQDTLDFVSAQLEQRRAALPGAARAAPEAEIPNPYPLTAEERALNAAADARAQAQPPHAGYLEDAAYGVDTETGLVAERPPAAAAVEGSLTPPSGATSAAAAAGAVPPSPADDLRQAAMRASEAEGVPPPVRTVAEAARTPTPAEEATPRRLPQAPDPLGPQRMGEGPPSTPEGRAASLEDDAMVDAMLSRSRGRARTPKPDDVKRVLNGIQSTKQSLTDRRARLGAVEKYIEETRGEKLQPNERAWLLSRVYEGREDAALLRMERMLQDPLTAVSKDYMPVLERVAVKLDNVDTDWLARMKEQRRVEGTIPEVRDRQQAPVSEIRRTGEAALNQQRAQANMRAAEREWIGAMNERNALLKEMDTLGEGPTRGVESEYARRQRAARGYGPDRVMETDRSMSAQERLERVNIRLETAKARHADARRIIAELRATKQDVAEGKTRVRAVERAETVGDARKYAGGATPQNVNDILANLVEEVGPEKAIQITDGLDALYRYRDVVRDRLVKSGVWSKDTGQEFVDKHPYYIPTKILEKLDEKFLNDLPSGGRTFSSSDDLIKHIRPEGTEADRMTPVRAILEMGFQGEAAARRNEVMKAVAGWAGQEGMENFVKKLTSSESAPTGYRKMAAMVDGEAQSIAVIEPLAQSLEMGNPGFTGILGAAAKGVSFPLRAGATALRPAFIATNAVNDAMLTLFRFAAEDPWYKAPNPIARARDLADLFNGYHLAFGAAKPATQAATGAFLGGGAESLREANEGKYPWNTPGYWQNIAAAATLGAGAGLARRLAPVDRAMLDRFRASGASMGMQSRFTNPDDIIRQLSGEHVWVRKLTSENDLAGWLNNRVGRASDVAGMFWSRPLGEVGKVIESAPRYAAFSRAERQTRQAIGQEIRAARQAGADMSDAQAAEISQALLNEQMPEIGNKARRVTADFAAGGSFLKTLNQISPFLNASTQAAVENVDMMQKNPSGYAAATAAIVAATVLAEIHNRSVAPEDYKNVSEFTKNTGIVILSDKEPEGEGKRGLVYIPTRGGPGMTVPLTKAAMSLYFGDDHRTWLKLATDVGLATANQMSPVNADIGGIVNMFVPPPISLINQARSNYDAFRDQPIVSRSMESLPQSEQYDDRTSQFARHLARMPGLTANVPFVRSPVMTDWLIKGISPGPGEAFLSAADEVIKQTGHALPEVTRDVPRGARDIPVYGPIEGRFLRTVGSAEQNRAYEMADELAARERIDAVRELEAMPAYQRATPDRQKQMLRSLESAITEKAQVQAGVEAKPKDIGQPTRWVGIEPGSALEREIASAIGANADDRTGRQKSLAKYYQGKETRTYTDWRKRQTRESQSVREMVR